MTGQTPDNLGVSTRNGKSVDVGEARELNRAIAEKVMGLTVVHSLALGGDWTGTSIEEGYARVLPYCSEIAPAMEVVENIRERGLRILMCDGSKGKWDCEIWNADSTVELALSRADSLPEAICRAALAAVGQEEKASV